MLLRRTLVSIVLMALVLSPGFLSAATKRKKTTAPDPAPVAPVAKKIPSAVGKPNILFIIVDDLNDWVGWLGGHPQTRTPNMDKLARMGMRFTNAHTAYALCNPSRTALLTGMAPASSGVFGNEQDWRRSVQIVGKPTLPEFFTSMGYTTAAGGKIYHANHGGPDGRLSGWHGGRRGFELDTAWAARFPEAGVQLPQGAVLPGRNFNGLDIWHWDWGPIKFDDDATEDGQTVAWAEHYLYEHRSKQPFFLGVGIYKPHSPWYVPQKYFDMFPLDQIKLPEVKADDLDDVPEFAKEHIKKGDNYHQLITSKNLWASAVQAYLANIAFADAQIGKLLDYLASHPAAKNTIICLTSDHGWYLGEKQMWHKGKLWERATHVPLTIYAPGVTQPDSVSNEPVSLLDLYPTLADLADLKLPEHLDGESLLPVLQNPAAKRERPAVTTMGGEETASYAARSDRWRYIRYADGSEELYDHSNDPNEWTNLASKPEHAEVKQSLAAAFPKEWHSAHRPLEAFGRIVGEDGLARYALQPGDLLKGADAPLIKDHGIALEAQFEFNPEVDQDSTLVSQGDNKNGWALHLVASKPTFTVIVDGKRTALTLDELKPGPNNLRLVLAGNGIIDFGSTNQCELIDICPFPAGFPVQPVKGLAVGESFGPLSVKDYPNSTPFDGRVDRLTLTVLP